MHDEKRVKRVRREEVRRNKRKYPRYKQAYNREFCESLWDYANLVPCIILDGILVIIAIICLIAAIKNAIKGNTFGTVFMSAGIIVANFAAVSIYAKVIHGEWNDCRNAAHKAGLKAKSGTSGDSADDEDEPEGGESPASGSAVLGADIMAACMANNNRH